MPRRTSQMFVDLADVKAQKVSWLMPPMIPRGMITIMEGDPGVGKSFLAMHIAAQVSIGGELPGGKRLRKGRVLYLSNEDDPSYTIRPRIDAMGGNPDNIAIQTEYLSLDDDGIDTVFAEVKRSPVQLIIVDPLFSYVPASQDAFKPNVIRSLLSQLKDIAEYCDAAVVIIRHLTKTKRDKAIYQGGGSMDVIGAARSAILVAEHPENSSQKVMAHLKHNISERGKSWIYELVQDKKHNVPVLKWVGPSDLTVDDLFSTDEVGRQSAQEVAMEYLKQQLGDGPRPTKKIEMGAEARGISKRTLDRARKELNIEPQKRHGVWILSLPKIHENPKNQN